MNTGISKKWSEFSKSLFENDKGRHCHWCTSIVHYDGQSHCSHPGSKYYGERIRSFDGESCAEECAQFELQPHYKSDEAYDKTFDCS